MIAIDTLGRLKAVVGPKGYIDDPDAIRPYCESWRDNWSGNTPLVLRPATTEEVAALVTICAETRTAIVPLGGNTGLTGASQPHTGGNEVVLSTNRMTQVREIDLDNDSLTVEAGVILAEVQRIAEDNDRLFPLSLAAEGSCCIGGNLSTNAGGVQVVRYGNARQLTLGIEVVLPDGRIWNGLRGLRKDNAGYDLKHNFIGAEGTLGIITAATLRLFPRPSESQTALVAIDNPASGVALFGRLRKLLGEAISAFELMERRCLDMVIESIPDRADPWAEPHPWYILLNISGQGSPGSLLAPLENALVTVFEEDLVRDAIIAKSDSQVRALWALREDLADAQKNTGVGIKHDISVPISRIAEFVTRADAALALEYPGIRFCTFGHIGDGNLHYNPLQPLDWEGETFKAETARINKIVHDLVVELGGSITAEHGLGRLRMAEAEHYKSEVELDLMRTIKRSLDPQNIMNPGKVIRV